MLPERLCSAGIMTRVKEKRVSEVKKQSPVTVEIFERAEEMSYRAAIQMEKDNVQITADMTPEEVVQKMASYYR